ncbi:MAG TPA: hypothetical protein VKQ30_03220 [Ktedonobacterales bacterium]|nr:hypothetical protein [Ktedonobacterales bacterium]
MANFISEAWDGIAAAPMGVKLAMGAAVGAAALLGIRQHKINQAAGVSQGTGLPLTGGDAGTQTVAGAPPSNTSALWNLGSGIASSPMPPTSSGGGMAPIPPIAPPVGPITAGAVPAGNGAIYQGVIPGSRLRPMPPIRSR